MSDALKNFAAADAAKRDNRTPRQYRDDVITLYLAVIEANYSAFGSRVSSERRELGLGIDLVIGAFTNYAAVASAQIVNDLSAAASGFASARGALDRNVYFDRTVPALLGSMDATRARIRTRIAEGMGRSEVDYPLRAAFDDLSLLESAGSLDRALVSVTGQVAADRDRAEADLATAVRSCNADADATPVVTRLSNYLHVLATPVADAAVTEANATRLRQIGLEVGLPVEVYLGALQPLRGAINARVGAGREGRCAKADLEALIVRIEQRTRAPVPPL